MHNAIYLALSLGLLFLFQFADYGLGFYYGSKLIEDKITTINDKVYTSGDVIVIFFSIMFSGFNLGQATPCIKCFELGKAAAIKIFSVLDRKPLIVSDDPNGKILPKITGAISF